MNGLALPSGQDQGWWAGVVGSGRPAGWMGVTVTGIPSPSDPQQPPSHATLLSYIQLTIAREGDRGPGLTTLVTPVWCWRREFRH